jgi:outer membrane biosynthesis protein TonB
LALCLSLLACAGPSHEREETTTSARTRRARAVAEAHEEDEAEEDEEAAEAEQAEEEAEDDEAEVAVARKAPALAAKPKPEVVEDPLVAVSRQIEKEKAEGATQPKAIEQHDEHAEKANKKVGVQGIHGTLSPFDVKVTMDKQSKAFAKCHEPRVRKVPSLAGGVEFNIRVLDSGEVADVLVRQSDLGDRILERCFSEVIRRTKFPAPHGGEATVQWNMALAPARKHRAPEEWDSDRIERVLKKNRGELLETCDVKRVGAITVTAYVSKRGKVLAAGVAAPDDRSAEHFDCIADELRGWSMPKPRKGVAKVSFALRG